MNDVYILIGGNMGDRLDYLSRARQAIEKNCGTIIIQSSLYETAAWGMKEQKDFLNQAMLLATEMNAPDLLHTLLFIEESLGRKRQEKYGPRMIDIDILLFNDDVVDQPGLKIPHPQMQYRRFVLQPLQEIAPKKIHPLLHLTISDLFDACTDPLMVNKFS
ncbi:MAG: 2-amino-4-hydroxy-6-hydroxymethyldihydropteridine diphosphokinase [Flavisolibacter sp.]